MRTRDLRRIPAALLVLALARTAHATAVDYDALARSARALLTRLVAADTTNPPGNEARAVALGAARLQTAGIVPEVTTFAPGRQNLVARLRSDGSGGGPVLVLAHVDVVGTSGQQWTSPPHRVTEHDGYLVGRGVSDDLGMAAVALEVLVAVKRSGVRLRRDLILAWTGDEESGGGGIRWLLANRPESIRAEMALNEGGGPRTDDDGKVRRIALQTAEKTYQDYVLVTHGTTGHSSMPLADNAITRLARALTRVGEYRFPARLLPVTRATFAARAAEESGAFADALRRLADSSGEPPADALAIVEQKPEFTPLLRTTCVATLLSGGTRVNALPAEATATVNCRVLPDERPADVQRALAEVIGDDAVEIRPTSEFGWGEPSGLEGPLPEAVRAVATTLWPGAPVVPVMSPGATDSRFLRAAGVAAYGLGPIPMSESDVRRAHGIDERIPAAGLRTGVEFLHRLVLALVGSTP